MTNSLTRFVTSHGKRIEVETLPSKEPARVSKRRRQFVMVPMWWYEKLIKPLPRSRMTVPVALYLLHSHWKHYERPFGLPNGALKYDGISRFAKYRALADLAARGLITIERRRRRRSPIIHVKT
jgi:hypothetical protein